MSLKLQDSLTLWYSNSCHQKHHSPYTYQIWKIIYTKLTLWSSVFNQYHFIFIINFSFKFENKTTGFSHSKIMFYKTYTEKLIFMNIIFSFCLRVWITWVVGKVYNNFFLNNQKIFCLVLKKSHNLHTCIHFFNLWIINSITSNFISKPFRTTDFANSYS